MSASRRRIDHLVLAVHDLDAAAAFYARLGFHVGARNRHPWGTTNHVIQFQSSFLELITVADADAVPSHKPGSFSFGRFVTDYLSHCEGLAMFVLDSNDAVADAAAYARQGIGDFAPFSFERSGRASDGSPTHVAFTLAFATDDRLPDAAFFVCQQHFPEAFWSCALQRHDNGATNVSSVTLHVPDPREHTSFFETFTGVHASEDGRHYRLAQSGRLDVHATENGPTGFSGFGVGVPDLEPVRRRLTAEGIPFAGLNDRVVVPPDQCFGAQITYQLLLSEGSAARIGDI